MSADACEPHGGCITCGDAGTPMRVIDVCDGTAVCVDSEGASQEVAVDLVDSVGEGQWLLVHAGVAIAVADIGAGAVAEDGGGR
jgi:hydrogenase assembly chaperone HypC/HupF